MPHPSTSGGRLFPLSYARINKDIAMKLRYSPASPYVRKVMVVALETGLAARIEKIPTTVVPVTPNEALQSENPLVKVPTLLTDAGEALYDSPVICEYLDS